MKMLHKLIATVALLGACGPESVEKQDACELHQLEPNVEREAFEEPTFSDDSCSIHVCVAQRKGNRCNAGIWVDADTFRQKCQKGQDGYDSCAASWCANMCTGEALK